MMLFMNQTGRVKGLIFKVKLRPGNVHNADEWQEFLELILRYYAGKGVNVKVRGDAAFAIPELYELLEELGIDYAIRIKENEKLTEKMALYTKRPVGRPGTKPVIKICQFPARCRFLGKGAENSSKDRTSSGRVISQDKIHRNQSKME